MVSLILSTLKWQSAIQILDERKKMYINSSCLIVFLIKMLKIITYTNVYNF